MFIELCTGSVVEVEFLGFKGKVDVYKIGLVKVEHEPTLNRIWVIYAKESGKKNSKPTDPRLYLVHKMESLRLINEYKYFLDEDISPANFCKEVKGGGKESKGKGKSRLIIGTPAWWTPLKKPVDRHRLYDGCPKYKKGEVMGQVRCIMPPEAEAMLTEKGYWGSCNACQFNRNKRCENACTDPLATSKVKILERRKEVATV